MWLVVRGIGKRSLAEMSPIDLLLVVVIGDIVQQAVTQEDMSVTGAILSVAVFTLWMLAGDAVSRRSQSASRVLSGSSVYVIEHGRPDLDVIHRERMTIEDIHEAARHHGIADLTHIAYGVLEPDGKFSFVTGDPATIPHHHPPTG